MADFKRIPERETFLIDYYKTKDPKIKFDFKEHPQYGVKSEGTGAVYNKVAQRAREWSDPSQADLKKKRKLQWRKRIVKEQGLPVFQKKRLAAIKAGLIYAKELEDVVAGKEGLGLSTSEKIDLRTKLSTNNRFMSLIKDGGYETVGGFMDSDYGGLKTLGMKIKGINTGKALEASGLALGSKTKRLTSKLEKDELLSFMNDYLGDKNTKFYLSKGYLPSTLDLSERPVDVSRKRANERYQQFLNEGFSTNKNRILWGNRPPKTVEGKILKASKEWHRPTQINEALGIKGDSALRFTRGHYFPIMAAGELKNKGHLAKGTFYSDRFTYRPAYINFLQKNFYDQPVLSDVGKFLRGTITKEELNKLIAEKTKNFEQTFNIDVDELQLDKKGKFEFVNKTRPSVAGTGVGRIPLIKNAIKELQNLNALQDLKGNPAQLENLNKKFS